MKLANLVVVVSVVLVAVVAVVAVPQLLVVLSAPLYKGGVGVQ